MSYFLKNNYYWFYYNFFFLKKINNLNLLIFLKIDDLLDFQISKLFLISMRFLKLKKSRLKITFNKNIKTNINIKNLKIISSCNISYYLINLFMQVITFILLYYFFLYNWYFYIKFKFLKIYQTNTNISNKFFYQKNIFNNTGSFYINFIYINMVYISISLFFLKLNYDEIYLLSFNWTNFNLYNIYIWIFINIFFFWTLKNLSKDIKNLFNLDYIFTIFNLIIFFILMFSCNNFYTFLLLLEICSYFFFYKLILSNHFSIIFISDKKNYEYLCSLIFYHYWISTFSTFFYIFFFLMLLNWYGSVYHGFLLFWIKQLLTFQENIYFFLFNFGFIFCFFFKLGFSPFHLFKFQIYENLSYFYLYFYTIYYFIGFFFIIITLFIKLIIPCINLFSNYLIIFIYICILILTFNLIYYKSFQQFLILSTTINLLNFLLIMFIFLL